MLPPPGYKGVQPDQVCKLVRSLYGLKQASREWNMEFCHQLFAQGFVQSPSNHCLFTRGSGDDFICLLVYVDDVLITSPSQHLIDELKQTLHVAFTIKDLGHQDFSWELKQLGVKLAQFFVSGNISQIFSKNAGLLGCKPFFTPLPTGLVLSQGIDVVLDEPDVYRRLVGQLFYLNLTRPDLSHATQQVSQFVGKPTHVHYNAALHMLKYLKGCPSYDIFISSRTDFRLIAYSDVDWGACLDTLKSLTGFCIFLGTTLLSWRCKKQK